MEGLIFGILRYFYIFSHVTLNETFTAKYGVLPRIP